MMPITCYLTHYNPPKIHKEDGQSGAKQIAKHLLFWLFFQAEDGIRDFCLSRGLGDVYKRQAYD